MPGGQRINGGTLKQGETHTWEMYQCRWPRCSLSCHRSCHRPLRCDRQCLCRLQSSRRSSKRWNGCSEIMRRSDDSNNNRPKEQREQHQRPLTLQQNESDEEIKPPRRSLRPPHPRAVRGLLLQRWNRVRRKTRIQARVGQRRAHRPVKQGRYHHQHRYHRRHSRSERTGTAQANLTPL